MWELVDFRGCSILISVLIHSSIQVLFFLNGCGSVGGCFLKKYFSLLLLSKLLRDSDSVDDDVYPCWVQRSCRPKERTSSCWELGGEISYVSFFVQ